MGGLADCTPRFVESAIEVSVSPAFHRSEAGRQSRADQVRWPAAEGIDCLEGRGLTVSEEMFRKRCFVSGREFTRAVSGA